MTLLKFEIETFYAYAQQKKFIKGIESNLDLESVSSPIIPPVSNAWMFSRVETRFFQFCSF